MSKFSIKEVTEKFWAVSTSIFMKEKKPNNQEPQSKKQTNKKPKLSKWILLTAKETTSGLC